MQLLSLSQQWGLPFQNPVLIFSLILFIILFAPIILNRFKIPHLIGLIIAGALIGPNGFYLMARDSSIELFGQVGLLYIMFLAGLEIDLGEFKKNKWRSLLFGMYTFTIPMALGIGAGLYLLRFPLNTSILLASMFASHTLITYPIVSKMGIAKNRAVNVTVGGTLITDTLALLVLAVIVGMTKGEINQDFWIRISASIIIFSLIIIFIFPIVARWFFKNYDDNISQYIFVLGLVFVGAFLAELAGIEAIIGAFLAGLALNRLIPSTSPLMNRIEFVGNALFIPFFLIGVGMLIDYRAFFKDFETIFVATVMVIVATLAKYIAAWLTQKSLRYSIDERRIIFGLSNSQAAATLAAVLVGYNIIIGTTPNGEPIRLLSESVLNGTIFMILITCTIASFVTQKGAQNIALAEVAEESEDEEDLSEKILIPLSDLESVSEIVNLSVMVKSKRNKSGLYALHVIDSDLMLTVQHEKGMSASFLNNLNDGILAQCNCTTLVYKSVQPLSTIKRHIVIVPDRAEREIGFPFWMLKLWNIARNSGSEMVFYSSVNTLKIIKEIQLKHPVKSSFYQFSDWDDFLILSRNVKINDNLVIVLSRKGYSSYHNNMFKIPDYLNKYFTENNYFLVYPIQSGVGDDVSLTLSNPSVMEPFREIEELRKIITKLFKNK
jgi:Kef-type K+ transport system membrane component KefB